MSPQVDNSVTVQESGNGPYAQVVTTGHHVIGADEPENLGGQDSGPSPLSIPDGRPWCMYDYDAAHVCKVATEHAAAVIVVIHDNKIMDCFDHIDSLRDGALETPYANAA